MVYSLLPAWANHLSPGLPVSYQCRSIVYWRIVVDVLPTRQQDYCVFTGGTRQIERTVAAVFYCSCFDVSLSPLYVVHSVLFRLF